MGLCGWLHCRIKSDWLPGLLPSFHCNFGLAEDHNVQL